MVTIKEEEASTAEPPYDDSGQGPAPYEVMLSLLENPSKFETPLSFSTALGFMI